ncbi:Ccl17 [Columba livia]|nr:Ccl17 [Columba livia]
MLTARTAQVLTALLTLSLCCDAAPSSPSECCYDYRNSRLPLAKLKGYYIAPPECFDPAIVCGFGAAGREGPAQHCVGDEDSVPRSPELSKEEHPITWRSWQGAE